MRTLLSEERPTGHHQAHWDGCGDAGRRVTAGVYFLRFEAGEVRQTRKVVLMD